MCGLELDLNEPKTLSEYIDNKCELLKDMRIWRCLTVTEVCALLECVTEVQVDNKVKAYIKKYL